MARTFGTELLEQLQDGRLAQLPSSYLHDVREKICLAMEELLDIGARIRPLLVGGQRIGWVRGVHLTERQMLRRWLHDDVEVVEHILRVGTSLSAEDIRNLSMLEMRSLARLVRNMTDSDMKLYPYLPAFSSTATSEQLWHSQGTQCASFRNREVPMPDGARIQILAASDQSRLWASLCNARIHAIERLEASSNAVLIIRPWAGRGADQIANSLKNAARALQTNSFEPWKDLIRVSEAAEFEDGWAHSEDDSMDGMMRELKGMASNDRHEQMVIQFERMNQERLDRQKQDIERRVAVAELPEDEAQTYTTLTEAEVQGQRDRDHHARQVLQPAPPQDEEQSSLRDRIARYK